MINNNDVYITSASECREWLLHFSVPVLDGVLPPLMYVHYTLLVSAINLLNKEKVQMDEISYAEILLLDFCRVFPEVYGEYDIKRAICCKFGVKSNGQELKRNGSIRTKSWHIIIPLGKFVIILFYFLL